MSKRASRFFSGIEVREPSSNSKDSESESVRRCTLRLPASSPEQPVVAAKILIKTNRESRGKSRNIGRAWIEERDSQEFRLWWNSVSGFNLAKYTSEYNAPSVIGK